MGPAQEGAGVGLAIAALDERGDGALGVATWGFCDGPVPAGFEELGAQLTVRDGNDPAQCRWCGCGVLNDLGEGGRGEGAGSGARFLHLDEPVSRVSVKTVDVLIALGDKFNKGKGTPSRLGEQEGRDSQLVPHAGDVTCALARSVPELIFEGYRGGRVAGGVLLRCGQWGTRSAWPPPTRFGLSLP